MSRPTLFTTLGTINILPGVSSIPSMQALGLTADEIWDAVNNPLSTNRDGSPTIVGQLFDCVTVDYTHCLLGMGTSIQQGSRNVVNAIRALSPGQKFCLFGVSQGAHVMSNVYKEIRSGVLQDRQADFLGGFACCNPARGTNNLLPGESNPEVDSHGIAGPSFRLEDPDPSLWWEATQPLDIVSVQGDDAGGHLYTAIFDWLLQDYGGALAELVAAAQAFFSDDDPDAVGDLVAEIRDGFLYGINAHIGYRNFAPIPGDDRTLFEVVTDRLVQIAANLPDDVPTPRSKGELVAQWNKDIATGDPRRVAKAARQLADSQAQVDPEWIFTRCDKFWRPAFSEMGQDIIQASGTDPRNKCASATLVLKGSSAHVPYLADCSKTMVGVKVETAGLKMAFYVKKHDEDYKDGAITSTSELRGIADIFQYMIIFPTWFLPIQIQPISHAVLAGTLVCLLENVIAECALRLQSGIEDFLNNALSLDPDIRTWFGTVLQALSRDGLSPQTLGRMLKTPVYVVRTNPFLDTSPLWAKTVRMESLQTVIDEATQSYGIDVSITLWEPGDGQPDNFAHLDQATYVVRVVDRTQITGPTHTVLDSVLRTAVDLAGSLGLIFAPLIKGIPGIDGVYVSPLLGINYHAPWAYMIAPEEGEDGSLVTCKISSHTQTGWQHIIGGKSPKWLVCAPRETVGHRPTRHLKRSHQCNAQLLHRRHPDHPRLHRHPVVGHPERLPQ